jgi:hypothetical protein
MIWGRQSNDNNNHPKARHHYIKGHKNEPGQATRPEWCLGEVAGWIDFFRMLKERNDEGTYATFQEEENNAGEKTSARPKIPHFEANGWIVDNSSKRRVKQPTCNCGKYSQAREAHIAIVPKAGEYF